MYIHTVVKQRKGRVSVTQAIQSSVLVRTRACNQPCVCDELAEVLVDVLAKGAQFIHFLLGPATVALALPLWDNRGTIRTSVAPIILALLTGSIVAAGSAIMLARAFGLPMEVLLSLAPKSTTAPVALGISEAIGGIPALTAVLVIMTGIIRAVTVTPLMNLLRITDWRARGFAVGVAAHGIGAARAFQVNPVAGAYACIAMALNALLTSLIVPLLVRLLV